jgi:hypothetical protein
VAQVRPGFKCKRDFYPFTSANNPYDAATIAIDAAGNLYVAGSASTEGTKIVRAPSFPSTAVATATAMPVIFSTDFCRVRYVQLFLCGHPGRGWFGLRLRQR